MATLLVVDDNEMNIDMLSRWLLRKGYDVLVAMNGAEAIEVASAKHPDLILMDLSMPVMDGWEASRQLKNLPTTQSTPVIALSAHAMDEDRISALAAGCDDYESKPLDLKRLTSKIEQLLANPPSPTETECKPEA